MHCAKKAFTSSVSTFLGDQSCWGPQFAPWLPSGQCYPVGCDPMHHLVTPRTSHSVPLIKWISPASGFCNNMILWEGVISPQHNPQPGGTGDHTKSGLYSSTFSAWVGLLGVKDSNQHSSMGHWDMQTPPPQSKLWLDFQVDEKGVIFHNPSCDTIKLNCIQCFVIFLRW